MERSFKIMKHIHETWAFLVKLGIFQTSVYNVNGSQNEFVERVTREFLLRMRMRSLGKNGPLRRVTVSAVARIMYTCDATPVVFRLMKSFEFHCQKEGSNLLTFLPLWVGISCQIVNNGSDTKCKTYLKIKSCERTPNMIIYQLYQHFYRLKTNTNSLQMFIAK